MSQPIRNAEPRKHANANSPNRSRSRGSSRISRANATETNAAKTVVARKWLDKHSVLSSNRDVEGVEHDEHVQ